MHKRRSNTEAYVGMSWLSRKLNINRGLVQYWAVKQRTRTFKFSGVRYIELEDSLCLLDFFKQRWGLSDEVTQPVKDRLEERRVSA